jgi:hypothetical protein
MNWKTLFTPIPLVALAIVAGLIVFQIATRNSAVQ